MQTSAMLEDWVTALREPWVRPMRALRGLATNRERKARVDGTVFRYVNPADLLRQVCWRTRERAAAKGVALLVYCACGPVRVQPQPFAAVLSCLLDDAIGATRSSPVLVSVREGADSDVLWQVRDPTERRARHALANIIVERHGGLLRFDSGPGIGARASIWIPPNAGPLSTFWPGQG